MSVARPPSPLDLDLPAPPPHEAYAPLLDADAPPPSRTLTPPSSHAATVPATVDGARARRLSAETAIAASRPPAPCCRKMRRRPWLLPVAAACQCAFIVAIGAYLIVLATRPMWPQGSVVEQFSVAPNDAGLMGTAAGCPIAVGQPVSFTDDGSVRKGAGTSLYRSLSQVFFSETIATHAVTALDQQHLVAAFAADDGNSYVMLATAVPAGDKPMAWMWSDMVALNPLAPDTIAALSNSTFVVAGGGYAAIGTVASTDGGITESITMSPPTSYMPSPTPSPAPSAAPAAKGPAQAPSPTPSLRITSGLQRCSLAVLTPASFAISFYTTAMAEDATNSSLVTRVAVIAQAARADVPAAPPPLRAAAAPAIVWGLPTIFANAHLSHAMAAFDSETYLLTFPMDDGVTSDVGFPLSVRAARVSTGLPTPTGFDGTAVTLGDLAVLTEVKAHYLFDVAAVGATQAVAVFIDAALSDGIRAVIINLRPGLAISFGSTLALNSGNAGGHALAGAWLHLSIKPLGRWPATPPPPPASISSRRAGGRLPGGVASRRRAASVEIAEPGYEAAADHYYDDDGFFDDDDGHTVVGEDIAGHSFAVIFSDMANYGRVTLLVGEVTPAADIITTSPAFVLSPTDYMAPAAADATAPSDDDVAPPGWAAGFYWVSAAVIAPTQLVILDTLDADTSGGAIGAAAALRRGGRCLHSSGVTACGASVAEAAAASSPAPLRYYSAAVANLSLLEMLHNPVGIALTDGGCGDSVRVLMQGVFAFTDGAPQNGAPITGTAAQPRGMTPGQLATVGGPFHAGKAYYADTRGRMVEGSYAGAGGLSASGGNIAGGYVTTVATKSGDGEAGLATSVGYEGYVGVAISANQLLIRPGL